MGTKLTNEHMVVALDTATDEDMMSLVIARRAAHGIEIVFMSHDKDAIALILEGFGLEPQSIERLVPPSLSMEPKDKRPWFRRFEKRW